MRAEARIQKISFNGVPKRVKSVKRGDLTGGFFESPPDDLDSETHVALRLDGCDGTDRS